MFPASRLAPSRREANTDMIAPSMNATISTRQTKASNTDFAKHRTIKLTRASSEV
jgi:hypothetical protein